MYSNNSTLDIPQKFNNSLTEHPFEHCKMCKKELLESESEYIIEKAYRKFVDDKGEQLLFEVAICLECASGMRSTLSKESVSNIQGFFFKKAMERKVTRSNSENFTEDPLGECLLNGKLIEDMEEYQIYAHCKGRKIAAQGGYYLLSDDIIETIQSLLSKETKDELQRFSDENFGIPPELQELFSRGDLIAL